MPDQTVQKTGLIEKAVSENTFRFVLSDETLDRDGDIISSDGWDLREFKKNPVALNSHDAAKLPIGRWKNLQVKAKQLIGDLELAPDDVGGMQRAINSLVRDGFLKAVSVGFRSSKREPLDEDNPYNGYRYLKQTLLECSLCAVPANPSALAIAKQFDLSPKDMSKLFIPQSSEDESTTVGSDAEKHPAVLKAKAAILAANKVIRSK